MAGLSTHRICAPRIVCSLLHTAGESRRRLPSLPLPYYSLEKIWTPDGPEPVFLTGGLGEGGRRPGAQSSSQQDRCVLGTPRSAPSAPSSAVRSWGAPQAPGFLEGSSRGAVLLKESGVQGCVPPTPPLHLGLGSEWGSRSKIGCSPLLPFLLYSNRGFIQTGMSCGCPALCALLKNTQTLVLLTGAASWRGFQSLSIV